MISISEHESLLEDQQNHYESRIKQLQRQLSSAHLELQQTKQEMYQNNTVIAKYDLHQQQTGNLRKSSIVLDDLVGTNQNIEDDLSDDDNFLDGPTLERKMTKSRLAHNRRATSMIIEDLIGYDDDNDDDNDTDTTTSSSGGASNGVFDAIGLEQQLLDNEYQHIKDADKLREIIETLKEELKRSRMNQLEIHNKLKEETIDLESELNNERNEKKKYKHLLHISGQLENINPDIMKLESNQSSDSLDDVDRILHSKLELIISLSIEFDRMREIIKQQQTHINVLNKNNNI